MPRKGALPMASQAKTTQLPLELPKLLVRAVLGNRGTTFECSAETKFALRRYFQYSKPGYRFAPSFRDGSWDGQINLMSYGRVATGLLLEKRKEIEREYQLSIEDRRIPLEFGKAEQSDRAYQNEGVQAMIDASNT